MREHLPLSHGHKAPATIDKCLENPCLTGARLHPKMLLKHIACHMACHLPTTVWQHKGYASTVLRNARVKFRYFHDWFPYA